MFNNLSIENNILMDFSIWWFNLKLIKLFSKKSFQQMICVIYCLKMNLLMFVTYSIEIEWLNLFVISLLSELIVIVDSVNVFLFNKIIERVMTVPSAINTIINIKVIIIHFLYLFKLNLLNKNGNFILICDLIYFQIFSTDEKFWSILDMERIRCVFHKLSSRKFIKKDIIGFHLHIDII